MKPTDFLPNPNKPNDPRTSASNDLPQPTEEPRKSWLSEAFEWALSAGAFLLLNNYLFGKKKDD